MLHCDTTAQGQEDNTKARDETRLLTSGNSKWEKALQGDDGQHLCSCGLETVAFDLHWTPVIVSALFFRTIQHHGHNHGGSLVPHQEGRSALGHLLFLLFHGSPLPLLSAFCSPSTSSHHKVPTSFFSEGFLKTLSLINLSDSSSSSVPTSRISLSICKALP